MTASHNRRAWDDRAAKGQRFTQPARDEDFRDPLAKVDAMRGVVFDWDAEHGGQHDVGFIGEEVGKVLPRLWRGKTTAVTSPAWTIAS